MSISYISKNNDDDSQLQPDDDHTNAASETPRKKNQDPLVFYFEAEEELHQQHVVSHNDNTDDEKDCTRGQSSSNASEGDTNNSNSRTSSSVISNDDSSQDPQPEALISTAVATAVGPISEIRRNTTMNSSPSTNRFSSGEVCPSDYSVSHNRNSPGTDRLSPSEKVSSCRPNTTEIPPPGDQLHSAFAGEDSMHAGEADVLHYHSSVAHDVVSTKTIHPYCPFLQAMGVLNVNLTFLNLVLFFTSTCLCMATSQSEYFQSQQSFLWSRQEEEKLRPINSFTSISKNPPRQRPTRHEGENNRINEPPAMAVNPRRRSWHFNRSRSNGRQQQQVRREDQRHQSIMEVQRYNSVSASFKSGTSRMHHHAQEVGRQDHEIHHRRFLSESDIFNNTMDTAQPAQNTSPQSLTSRLPDSSADFKSVFWRTYKHDAAQQDHASGELGHSVQSPNPRMEDGLELRTKTDLKEDLRTLGDSCNNDTAQPRNRSFSPADHQGTLTRFNPSRVFRSKMNRKASPLGQTSSGEGNGESFDEESLHFEQDDDNYEKDDEKNRKIRLSLERCNSMRFPFKKKLILSNLGMSMGDIPLDFICGTTLGNALQTLSLSGNHFGIIPELLVQSFPNLTCLDLSQCRLHHLPCDWNLLKLKKLLLSNNNLRDFPGEVRSTMTIMPCF